MRRGFGPLHVLSLLGALLGAGCGGEKPGIDSGPGTADSLVAAAVEEGIIPGAVLLVAHEGRTIREAAYGYAQSMRLPPGIPPDLSTKNLYAAGPGPLEPPRSMTPGTSFDLASVTKVMATTMALMLLVDRDEVGLDAPVHRYLPEFRGPHRDSVTVRHLLTHSAGLAPWQPLYFAAGSPEEAFGVIGELPLSWGVGEGRHYSDLGFMLLGYLVEAVTGLPLDRYLRQELYGPLGLERTGFRRSECQESPRTGGEAPMVAGAGRGQVGPTGGAGTGLDVARAPCPAGPFAATSHGNPYEWRMVHDSTFGYSYSGDPTAWDGWRRYTLSGEVNDGNAFHAHQGVAGHAGLFSTAAELHRLLQLLLDGGASRDRRLLREETVSRFLRPTAFGQALGWQTPAWAPEGSFSHTGFTGTFVMGIPSRGLSVILLTNRQNLGVGEDTRYRDLGGLQEGVVLAILKAVGRDTPGSGPADG